MSSPGFDFGFEGYQWPSTPRWGNCESPQRAGDSAHPNVRGASFIFFDTSKKGSRRSCSMNICGNKLKVAAYQRSLRLLSRVSGRNCIPISSPYYRKGTPGMVKSMQRERGLPRLTASVPVAQAQCQLALHGPMPDAVMASVHNRMP